MTQHTSMSRREALKLATTTGAALALAHLPFPIAMDATSQKVHDTRNEVRRNKGREIAALRAQLEEARAETSKASRWGFLRR